MKCCCLEIIEKILEYNCHTGVEAGMEQVASWARAAFLSISRCESMSLRAWSMKPSLRAWLLGTLCFVTRVMAKTRAATLVSRSLASNGGYRLRTTSSTRGGIRLATCSEKN